MSEQNAPITLSRRLELDLHADDYARLERAAQDVGLSIEEYLCVAASRWLAEAPMPGQSVPSMKRKLELLMHPDDYSLVERAAHAVGYTVEEYSRLSLHLQSRGMIGRPVTPPVIERPTGGMVQQVASWLTSFPATTTDRTLRRIGERNNVGVPHE
ncbi:hypothetical protein [Cupriavidus taiwanensis]|uniref:Uncharacterized protein n=1 Tax=Cupriavidus taiwanensis TaxID=164546 RepID=A0A7Z7JFN3_9BURK|nr:hypothetical protein [Cupriavidus taiwanensis]SOZ17410.1 hypothetical protein CBM2597_U10215 [Cupriavidus taiwanensis]SOZ96327.1 hypothetical protein CBM2598_U10137 [Cupriavidus taiwanensis]SPC25720.1 hypothetical protein CBM2594_U10221 [Cupriavidus taiwanensis]